MFEGWIADILATYLGRFVDVQKDQLRISLWSGEGTLHNVQLRLDALDYLELPFTFSRGCIGELKLQIPWGAWRSGPLVVELKDVQLEAQPMTEDEWSLPEASRREQAAKQAQLAAEELKKLSRRMAQGPGTSTSGWGSGLQQRAMSYLLNNLTVTISGVHIGFKIPATTHQDSLAFGITVSHVSTCTDAAELQEARNQLGEEPQGPSVIRYLHLTGWSVYWRVGKETERAPRDSCQDMPGPLTTSRSVPQEVHCATSQQGTLSRTRSMGHWTLGAGTGLDGSSDTSPVLRRASHSDVNVLDPGEPQGASYLSGPQDPCAWMGLVHPVVDEEDCLVTPLSAHLRVVVEGPGTQGSTQRVELLTLASDVTFQLRQAQLSSIMRLLDLVAVWRCRNMYGRYRPQGWVTTLEAVQPSCCREDSTPSRSMSGAACMRGVQQPSGGRPVSWQEVWQYAILCVLSDLHRRDGGLPLVRRGKNFLEKRRKYIYLWQKKLEDLDHRGLLTDTERLDLRALEVELSTPDILRFRTLAELNWLKKAEAAGDRVEGGEVMGDQQQRKHWLTWGLSGVGAFLGGGAQRPLVIDPPSDEAIMELQQMMREEEEPYAGGGSLADVPLVVALTMKVQRCAARVRSAGPPYLDLLTAQLEDSTVVLHHGGGTRTCLLVEVLEVSVFDRCSDPGVQEQVVIRLERPLHHHQRDMTAWVRGAVEPTPGAPKGTSRLSMQTQGAWYLPPTTPPILQISLELHPERPPRVEAQLLPVKITYRPKWLAALTETLQPGLDHPSLFQLRVQSVAGFQDEAVRRRLHDELLSQEPTFPTLHLRLHELLVLLPAPVEDELSSTAQVDLRDIVMSTSEGTEEVRIQQLPSGGDGLSPIIPLYNVIQVVINSGQVHLLPRPDALPQQLLNKFMLSAQIKLNRLLPDLMNALVVANVRLSPLVGLIHQSHVTSLAEVLGGLREAQATNPCTSSTSEIEEEDYPESPTEEEVEQWLQGASWSNTGPRSPLTTSKRRRRQTVSHEDDMEVEPRANGEIETSDLGQDEDIGQGMVLSGSTRTSSPHTPAHGPGDDDQGSPMRKGSCKSASRVPSPRLAPLAVFNLQLEGLELTYMIDLKDDGREPARTNFSLRKEPTEAAVGKIHLGLSSVKLGLVQCREGLVLNFCLQDLNIEDHQGLPAAAHFLESLASCTVQVNRLEACLALAEEPMAPPGGLVYGGVVLTDVVLSGDKEGELGCFVGTSRATRGNKVVLEYCSREAVGEAAPLVAHLNFSDGPVLGPVADSLDAIPGSGKALHVNVGGVSIGTLLLMKLIAGGGSILNEEVRGQNHRGGEGASRQGTSQKGFCGRGSAPDHDLQEVKGASPTPVPGLRTPHTGRMALFVELSDLQLVHFMSKGGNKESLHGLKDPLRVPLMSDPPSGVQSDCVCPSTVLQLQQGSVHCQLSLADRSSSTAAGVEGELSSLEIRGRGLALLVAKEPNSEWLAPFVRVPGVIVEAVDKEEDCRPHGKQGTTSAHLEPSRQFPNLPTYEPGHIFPPSQAAPKANSWPSEGTTLQPLSAPTTAGGDKQDQDSPQTGQGEDEEGDDGLLDPLSDSFIGHGVLGTEMLEMPTKVPPATETDGRDLSFLHVGIPLLEVASSPGQLQSLVLTARSIEETLAALKRALHPTQKSPPPASGAHLLPPATISFPKSPMSLDLGQLHVRAEPSHIPQEPILNMYLSDLGLRYAPRSDEEAEIDVGWDDLQLRWQPSAIEEEDRARPKEHVHGPSLPAVTCRYHSPGPRPEPSSAPATEHLSSSRPINTKVQDQVLAELAAVAAAETEDIPELPSSLGQPGGMSPASGRSPMGLLSAGAVGRGNPRVSESGLLLAAWSRRISPSPSSVTTTSEDGSQDLHRAQREGPISVPQPAALPGTSFHSATPLSCLSEGSFLSIDPASVSARSGSTQLVLAAARQGSRVESSDIELDFFSAADSMEVEDDPEAELQLDLDPGTEDHGGADETWEGMRQSEKKGNMVMWLRSGSVTDVDTVEFGGFTPRAVDQQASRSKVKMLTIRLAVRAGSSGEEGDQWGDVVAPAGKALTRSLSRSGGTPAGGGGGGESSCGGVNSSSGSGRPAASNGLSPGSCSASRASGVVRSHDGGGLCSPDMCMEESSQHGIIGGTGSATSRSSKMHGQGMNSDGAKGAHQVMELVLGVGPWSLETHMQGWYHVWAVVDDSLAAIDQSTSRQHMERSLPNEVGMRPLPVLLQVSMEALHARLFTGHTPEATLGSTEHRLTGPFLQLCLKASASIQRHVQDAETKALLEVPEVILSAGMVGLPTYSGTLSHVIEDGTSDHPSSNQSEGTADHSTEALTLQCWGPSLSNHAAVDLCILRDLRSMYIMEASSRASVETEVSAASLWVSNLALTLVLEWVGNLTSEHLDQHSSTPALGKRKAASTKMPTASHSTCLETEPGLAVSFRADKVGLLVKEDSAGSAVPLLEVVANPLTLRGLVDLPSLDLDLQVEWKLLADVYNIHKCGWEPVVDEWTAGVKVMTRSTGQAAARSNLSIKVQSEVLELTVTAMLVEALTACVQMLKGAGAGTQGCLMRALLWNKEDEDRYCPCWLENLTGCPMTCAVDHSGGTDRVSLLEDGQAMGLYIKDASLSEGLQGRHMISRLRRSVSEYHETPSFLPVDHRNVKSRTVTLTMCFPVQWSATVAVDRVTRTSYPLPPQSTSGVEAAAASPSSSSSYSSSPLAVVCDVQPYAYGIPILQIHSNVCLVNNTSMPISVGAQTRQTGPASSPSQFDSMRLGNKGKEMPTRLTVVLAGGAYWLPLNLLTASPAHLFISPRAPNRTALPWSRAINLRTFWEAEDQSLGSGPASGTQTGRVRRTLYFDTPGTSQRPVVLCLGLDGDPEGSGLLHLRIDPPGVFHNHLPVPVDIMVEGNELVNYIQSHHVLPGAICHLYECDARYLNTLRFRLPDYPLSRRVVLQEVPPQISRPATGGVPLMKGQTEVAVTNSLGGTDVFKVLVSRCDATGSLSIRLACALAITNKTELPLSFRAVLPEEGLEKGHVRYLPPAPPLLADPGPSSSSGSTKSQPRAKTPATERSTSTGLRQQVLKSSGSPFEGSQSSATSPLSSRLSSPYSGGGSGLVGILRQDSAPLSGVTTSATSRVGLHHSASHGDLIGIHQPHHHRSRSAVGSVSSPPLRVDSGKLSQHQDAPSDPCTTFLHLASQMDRLLVQLSVLVSNAAGEPSTGLWSPTLELSLEQLHHGALVTPLPRAPEKPGGPTGVSYLSVHLIPLPLASSCWAIHITANQMLHNHLPHAVQFRQGGSHVVDSLPAGSSTMIFWPDASLACNLQLRLREPGWSWSGAISLTSPGDVLVKMRQRNGTASLVVRVDVHLDDQGHLHCVVSPHDVSFVPYRIDNCSGLTLHLQQEGCLEEEDVLGPYTSLPYVWDEPSLPHRLVCMLPGRRLLGRFDFTKVGTCMMVSPEGSTGSSAPKSVDSLSSTSPSTLAVSITADGPTRVLTITDTSAHPSPPRGAASFKGRSPRKLTSWSRGGGRVQEAPELDLPNMVVRGSSPQLQFLLDLAGVGVSLVSDRQEILYLEVQGVGMLLEVSQVQYRLNSTIRTVRLDNCLPGAQYRTLLALPVRQSLLGIMLPGAREELRPAGSSRAALILDMSLWRSRPGGVMCFQDAQAHLSPVSLNVEGMLLKVLLKFFIQIQQATWGRAPLYTPEVQLPMVSSTSIKIEPSRSNSLAALSTSTHGCPDLLPATPSCTSVPDGRGTVLRNTSVHSLVRLGSSVPSLHSIASQETPHPRQLQCYIEHLSIPELQLCLSFAPGSWFDDVTEAVETTERRGEQHEGPGMPSFGDLATLLATSQAQWLARLLALTHTEEAWITLPGYQQQHPIVSVEALTQMLTRHYILAVYSELPRLLASLDILGDPARLFRNLGVGFWHLFSLPAVIKKGPSRSLIAFQNGLRVIVYALTTSLAKYTRRALVAMDGLGPPEVALQVSMPHGSNAHGSFWSHADYPGAPSPSGRDWLPLVVGGYAGIFQRLVNGLVTNNLQEALATVGRELLRAMVLPLMVILETSHSWAVSIRTFVSGQQQRQRVRIPRYVHPDVPLRPYNWLDSLGRMMLNEVMHGHFIHEQFVACYQLREGHFAVVSNRHLLCVCLTDIMPGEEVRVTGVVRLKDIIAVQVDAHVIKILRVGPSLMAQLSMAEGGPSGPNQMAWMKQQEVLHDDQQVARQLASTVMTLVEAEEIHHLPVVF